MIDLCGCEVMQPGGLPSLGHIVRNSIDFIKESVSPFPSKPGIFSQSFQESEHKTSPADRSELL
ncbi:hypothetical protein ACFSOZ_33205 [Mesorhizobium newzealandense]|uniref:Uncharacterized protein n=1 Tax=Mesorhizobium newzealandense TaxID=1300302 RepID=A0ABW4UM65_9HYPH